MSDYEFEIAAINLVVFLATVAIQLLLGFNLDIAYLSGIAVLIIANGGHQ